MTMFILPIFAADSQHW